MADKRGFDPDREQAFDKFLQENLSPLPPPEDMVRQVTPWRRAMDRILWGMALSSITLNFALLNYILPAVGILLLLLGFRTLRQENRGFRACWILSLIRCVYFLAFLILNAIPAQDTFHTAVLFPILTYVNLFSILLLYICLGSGIKALQQKAGLPVHIGAARALVIYFILMCIAAFLQAGGLILFILMLIAYICILRNLHKLSKELDEAGYSVRSAPLRLSDRALGALLAIPALLAILAALLFLGRYPMDWQAADPAEQARLQEIADRLLELGAPEDLVADLSAEDLAACADAKQVFVHEEDLFFPHRGADTSVLSEQLHSTGLAVQLPGAENQWKLFHHFRWIRGPRHYGMEALQLWPASRNGEAWYLASDYSGRLLCEKGGYTQSAAFYRLDTVAYQSNSWFFGLQDNVDVFAEFSFPRGAENCRGYISYTVGELEPGWILDAWINYIHQTSFLQYPAQTARTYRMNSSFSSSRDAFQLMQDAIQFHQDENGAPIW